MAVIPVGYAQVNWRYEGNGLAYPAEHTCGFDISAFSGDPTDLADLCFNEWSTSVMANLTSVVSLVSCDAKFGPNDLGPSGSHNGSQAGSVAGAGTAPMNAFLVHKHTSIGGRVGRGRMYLPGVSEGAVGSDGDLDNTVVSNLESDIGGFFVVLNAADAVPVLLHSEGSPVVTPTPITTFTVDGHVATQRRRNRR